MRRAAWLAAIALGVALFGPSPALGQALTLDFGEGGGLTGRIVQLLALLTDTFSTVAPTPVNVPLTVAPFLRLITPPLLASIVPGAGIVKLS